MIAQRDAKDIQCLNTVGCDKHALEEIGSIPRPESIPLEPEMRACRRGELVGFARRRAGEIVSRCGSVFLQDFGKRGVRPKLPDFVVMTRQIVTEKRDGKTWTEDSTSSRMRGRDHRRAESTE